MSYHKLKAKPSPNTSHRDAFVIANDGPSVAIIKVPTLKTGNDAKQAKLLNKLIKDAESGVVRILKAGFFLECLAQDLPHGQIGPWVEAHCNRKWRTVQRWKQVAAGVGETLGISLKQRLEYKLHEVLALPLKKVPEELKAVREKLDAEISGKSYRQLFLELKQVEEDADGNAKVKHGRLKGQGGATAEQRAAAAELEETHRLMEVEEGFKEAIAWQLENADAKHAGMMHPDLLTKLREANQNMNNFIRNLQKARKGNVQPGGEA